MSLITEHSESNVGTQNMTNKITRHEKLSVKASQTTYLSLEAKLLWLVYDSIKKKKNYQLSTSLVVCFQKSFFLKTVGLKCMCGFIRSNDSRDQEK